MSGPDGKLTFQQHEDEHDDVADPECPFCQALFAALEVEDEEAGA